MILAQVTSPLTFFNSRKNFNEFEFYMINDYQNKVKFNGRYNSINWRMNKDRMFAIYIQLSKNKYPTVQLPNLEHSTYFCTPQNITIIAYTRVFLNFAIEKKLFF